MADAPVSRRTAAVGLPVGVAPALAAALLFGASTPLAKVLLGDFSPFQLAGLLYLGSGLGMGVLWLLQRGRGVQTEAPLLRGDFVPLAFAILAGGVAGPLLLMSGLNLTPSSSASLLLNLEGVLTTLLAWVIFREHWHPRIIGGMLAITAGGVVLSWSGDATLATLRGPLLIGGACLAWGIDNNLTRKVSGGDPVQITMLKGLVAGTVNLGIASLTTAGAIWPTAGSILAAGLLGFLAYGVSLVCFIVALRHLGTARTGAYFSTGPFFGALLGILLLREPVSGQLVAASLLMGVGIWLHLSEQHEHSHTHEPLTHAHRHRHDIHHQHVHPIPVDGSHSHVHSHEPLTHSHPHFPDLHHRHGHAAGPH